MAGLAILAVTAVTIASLPLTAVASSEHAAATPAGIKICGTINGPHWSYQGGGGSRYIVYTRHGGACAMALKWVPRLITKVSRTPPYLITGGPSGWVCANTVVHFGICSQEIGGHPTAGSKAFAWAGKK